MNLQKLQGFVKVFSQGFVKVLQSYSTMCTETLELRQHKQNVT